MPIRGGTVINIAGTTPVDDPEYRYKMPAVYGKIEGSGNGIKTVIPNISEVALSLHRNPGEVNKFFGCELGAQTTYNEDSDRAVVNGAHTDDTLQNLIHRYVEGFVLCPNCRLVSYSRSSWLLFVYYSPSLAHTNLSFHSLFYSRRRTTRSRAEPSITSVLLAAPKTW
jgi:Domain found in IF2B/IF5